MDELKARDGCAAAVAFAREIEGIGTSVSPALVARYRHAYDELDEREQFEFLHTIAEHLTSYLEETTRRPVDRAADLMSDWFLRPV